MYLVSNATVLIALDRIGQLRILHDLFGKVIVTPTVCAEVFKHRSKPKWIAVQDVQDVSFINTLLTFNVHRGEAESIALAREINAPLLLDEKRARCIALSVGLRVIGTLTILLLGKRKGLIASVKPLVEALEQADFYISDQLRMWVLEEAGEI